MRGVWARSLAGVLAGGALAGGVAAQEDAGCGARLGPPGRLVSLGVPADGAPKVALCLEGGAPLEAASGSQGASQFPFAPMAYGPEDPVAGESWAVTTYDPSSGSSSCVFVALNPSPADDVELPGNVPPSSRGGAQEYFVMPLTQAWDDATCEGDPWLSSLIDVFSASDVLGSNETGLPPPDWGSVQDFLQNRTSEFFDENGPVMRFLDDIQRRASNVASDLLDRVQGVDLGASLSNLLGGLGERLGLARAAQPPAQPEAQPEAQPAAGARAPVLDSPDCRAILAERGVPEDVIDLSCP